MALESLTALDLSRSSFPEALGCALVCFQFRHKIFSILCSRWFSRHRFRRLRLLVLLRLRLVRLFGHWRLPRWGEDRMHGVSFHAGPELHDSFIGNFLDQPLQDVTPKILMRHLAPPEAQTGFYLVAFRQKTQNVIPLGHVVMLIYVDAEFHLFQDDLLLVLLCRPFFLFLFIQKFAVIHDPANRRNSIRGYFDQVEIDLAGFFERLVGWHDAKLIALCINHAYLSRADALIHANEPFIYASLLKIRQSMAKDLKIIAWQESPS